MTSSVRRDGQVTRWSEGTGRATRDPSVYVDDEIETVNVHGLGKRSVPKPSRLDGWINVLNGLGNQARDKRLSASFARSSILTFDRQTLEDAFHGEDMIGRICELPAKEMIREWVEFSGDPENELGAELQRHNARGKVFEALVWGRLYGGSLLVVGANDGQTMDKPLNYDKIKSIDFLSVIDRWDLWITSRYDDPTKPNFGEPEMYSIRTSAIVIPGTGSNTSSILAEIHESRVLKFDGMLTGRRRKRDNQGWNLSVIERVYDVVRDFSQSHAAVAHILQDFSQAVFKIKGLAGLLAADNDALVLKRFQILDMARSIARAIPLDADGEDFKREATPVAGLPDLIDRVGTRLAAATGIPITLLLGESPGGLNATGDSDHRYWYNQVACEQELTLRPNLARLFRMFGKACGLKPSDAKSGEYAFEFKKLWQATAAEEATTRKTVAETDQIYYGMGVLDTAEIAVSRFGGDKYSSETMIDKDMHDNNATDPDDDGDVDAADPEDSGNKAANAENLAKTALNGQQITALQALLSDVKTAALDPAAAVIAIGLLFPAFDPAKIQEMIAAIEVKEPPPPPTVVHIGPDGKPIPAPVGAPKGPPGAAPAKAGPPNAPESANGPNDASAPVIPPPDKNAPIEQARPTEKDPKIKS